MREGLTENQVIIQEKFKKIQEKHQSQMKEVESYISEVHLQINKVVNKKDFDTSKHIKEL